MRSSRVVGWQCCRSGIRCLFDPGIRDGEKVRIRIRDGQPGSYFLELRNYFGVKIFKILWCGSGIREGKNSEPGWKKVGSRINIPGLQQWFLERLTANNEVATGLGSIPASSDTVEYLRGDRWTSAEYSTKKKKPKKTPKPLFISYMISLQVSRERESVADPNPVETALFWRIWICSGASRVCQSGSRSGSRFGKM